MRAMILAAGLGTRLRPLTDDRPKALVEVARRTMLEITLARLREFGIRDVIVNVHHFADQVVEYLNAKDNFGMQIEVSREDDLLDTGGGLKKAAWFFEGEDHFVAMNADVLTDMDIRTMINAHIAQQPMVTLAVTSRSSNLWVEVTTRMTAPGCRWPAVSSTRTLSNTRPSVMSGNLVTPLSLTPIVNSSVVAAGYWGGAMAMTRYLPVGRETKRYRPPDVVRVEVE